MFDAIEFHKMRKFLASKLRTIVQCTGNPYLANSFRKMAVVVVADVFCRMNRSQASENVSQREISNAHFRPKRNQRELGTKDYSAITKVLEESLQVVF